MLRRKVLSLATALTSLVTSGLAAAQETTAPPPAPPPAAEPAPAPPAAAEPAPATPAAAAAGKEEKTEEITVTGTRIRRKDLTTPAPVTVINREQITASGKVSLGDFLQALPEQGNAINTAVNNGGNGASQVSLRSLGTARTLVLLNGRRMPQVSGSLGTGTAVDLGTIPTAAIERIEVLKDGASSVYGSDAIGGVVNIITRRSWKGVEASAYGGVAGAGDARTTDVNLTAGTSSDRGSLLFSAGMFDQRKAMAGDRSFSKSQLFFDASGLNNANGIVGEYQSGSSRTPGGRVSATGTGDAAFSALQNSYFTSAGKKIAGFFIHDSSIAASDPKIASCLATGAALADCQWRPMNTTNMAGAGGDLYNFAPVNYLLTPNQRISLFSVGDTKLGDVGRGYFEASYVNRQSKRQLAPEPLIIGPGGVTDPGGNLVTISPQNFYNPFGKTFTSSSRRLEEFGPRIQTDDMDTFRVVTGLDGTLPEAVGPLAGWYWDSSFTYGRSYGTYVLQGNLQSSRVQAALGPSKLVNGKPACVDSLGNVISGCVPLDLFHGSGSITQDQVNYLTFTGTSNSLNQMNVLALNTSGELFPLFSDRPMGLAFGYSYSYLAGAWVNDPLTAKFDSSNGGSYDTRGSYHVNEGYGELSIPIAGGRPLLEDLEASLSARAFDYSNFGSDWTYKFGARYRPIRDVTFRGTYSTAFRAPSIYELYNGQFDNFPIVSDPCAFPASGAIAARCGAAANNGDDSVQLRSRNGGNPDLKPETAKIYTIGIVYEPRYLPNFSATLDYYNIKVDKAITQIGESTILNGCYVSGLQPQYCSFIVRDPGSQQVTNIINLNQNVGQEAVAGLDLAMRYSLPTVGFGRFGFTFDGTWLQRHNQTLADGTLVIGKNTFDLTTSSGEGATNAAYKFNAGVVWGLGALGAGLSTKFISGYHECGDPNGDFSGSGLCYVDSTFQRRVSAYNTYDAFVSYQLRSPAGRTSLSFGVNNLFDQNPPKIYNTFASATDQYTYDQIGRFFYVRVAQAY
jgi:iron complex outermembrane recepter protein